MKPIFDTGIDRLLSGLERRDAAVWIVGDSTLSDGAVEKLAALVALPWKLALLESIPPNFSALIDAAAGVLPDLSRRRGFVHVIDTNPTQILLPPRCLPVYMLDGSPQRVDQTSFVTKLLRYSMIEELRQSGATHLFVVASSGRIPPEIADLWREGFRPSITTLSNASDIDDVAAEFLASLKDAPGMNLIRRSIEAVSDEVVARFLHDFPQDRAVLRVRDASGASKVLDVTDLDDVERPVLEKFYLIQERDLTRVTPEELEKLDLLEFFRDSSASWRPYAAGLPWPRDGAALANVKKLLRKLDSEGESENSIAYISCEAGAGGTTLSRQIAWACAAEGYPTLVASPLPFDTDPLPVTNYLSRVQAALKSSASSEAQAKEEAPSRRYEAPWVIIFDVIHWRSR